MNETQIKLYAALRVAVPLKWRIRGETVSSNITGWPPTQVIEFSCVKGPRNGGRYVERFRMQVEGNALRRAPAQTIRHAVLHAQRHVGIYQPFAVTRAQFVRDLVSVYTDGRFVGDFERR